MQCTASSTPEVEHFDAVGASLLHTLETGHGERSRLQLHFKLGGQENSLILAVNVLAVNRPVPLYIVSKSAFCTLNSVKKRVAHPIYSVFYALSVLFEVVFGAADGRVFDSVRSEGGTTFNERVGDARPENESRREHGPSGSDSRCYEVFAQGCVNAFKTVYISVQCLKGFWRPGGGAELV